MPAAVEAPTVIVIVDEPDPGAAMLDGLKLAVAPVGKPLAVSATAAKLTCSTTPLNAWPLAH